MPQKVSRTDARTDNLKPICPINFFEVGGIIKLFHYHVITCLILWFQHVFAVTIRSPERILPSHRAVFWSESKNTKSYSQFCCTYELPHDKTNKMSCVPSEDSDQPRHPPSLMSSLSAWRKLGSLATHWAHSEDSAQSDLSLCWAHKSFCWFCHFLGVWGDSFAFVWEIANFPQLYLYAELKKSFHYQLSRLTGKPVFF